MISPDPNSPSDRPVLERKRHKVEVSGQTALDLIPTISRLVFSGVPVLVVCNHASEPQLYNKSLKR